MILKTFLIHFDANAVFSNQGKCDHLIRWGVFKFCLNESASSLADCLVSNFTLHLRKIRKKGFIYSFSGSRTSLQEKNTAEEGPKGGHPEEKPHIPQQCEKERRVDRNRIKGSTLKGLLERL